MQVRLWLISDLTSEEIIKAMIERNDDVEKRLITLRTRLKDKKENFESSVDKYSKSDQKSVYLQTLNKKIDLYRQDLNKKKKVIQDFSPILFNKLSEEHTKLKNNSKKLAEKIQELKKDKVLLEHNIQLLKKYNNYQFVR